ncbi:RNA polymerase II subunit A C-terminal domain phosphatase [Aspergillus melleus]|uniref:RNA polymerase II subunit A C-terminal domain phosphatase n=1 Tax=Aspergillus melleus TaxID=138277 RepID=UPI001E8CE1F0|nr:RNA polymerase II subunit A C-terminal domain phosphatase [Aspergillus melleus]KAH8423151.1 RNA polymerase II subunit A C-terminal domain phosphatase [Aspergillus melleus]
MAYDPRLSSAGTATPDPPPPPPPPPPPEPVASTNTPTMTTDEEQRTEEQGQEKEAVAAGAAEKGTTTSESESDSYKLRFCTVCASNQNRSMEAHLRLSTASSPFPVISFGTGSLVRLPGPSITQPNVYSFNSTSYAQMYDELLSKDERLYRNNGLLNMLERNRNLKWGPERFQDWVPGLPRVDHIAKGDRGAVGTEGGVVDVIITCEERCWDAVVDDLMNKGSSLNRPVHVFNVDIKDNHEEALVGGKAILELANRLNEAAVQERHANGVEGWENGTGEARRSFDEKVPDILAAWQEKWPNLPALWTLAWL